MLFGFWSTYIALIVIGIMFSVCGFTLTPSNSRWITLTIGFSTALIASGVIGLIHTYYLQKEILSTRRNKSLEILGLHMYEHGFRENYPVRPLNEIKNAIEKAERQIKITGSSLKGLIGVEEPSEEQMQLLDLILEKVKKGLVLKIFLTHPVIAGQREKMEGREKGWIPVEILKNLIRLVDELQRAKNRAGSWYIRLYRCGPTVFTFEIDNKILFLQPYSLAGPSMENFCIRCEIPTEENNNLKRFVSSHFNSAWKMASPLPITKIHSMDDVVSLIKESVETCCINNEQAQTLYNLIGECNKRNKKLSFSKIAMLLW
ncbi:MAG: hypothetical protein GF353_10615 [Candidatus Lokiarchaeota archaeon]|nr:hypothetical protein [Candidatus Lokiarchaeota archaeon]